VSLSQKLNKMIAGGSLDYNSWRSLILEIETASPEDINTISLAYDSFLSMFPLCHWHLEKYAHHKAKLCSPQDAVNIYEREVGVAMFSVGFWVDYFTFGTACFGDPEDVRRLFRRAVSFVEKDYFCHVLWDKYMKYEFSQEGWSFLAKSYIQALRFPTKKLHFYYDNFKQFVANLEEEMGYEKNNSIVEQVSVPSAATEISTDEMSRLIKDLLDSSDRSLKSKALDRYRSIGEEFYQEACQMDDKIKCFETKIRRRYFYITPLDDDQLNNWHLYLDFIEKRDNLDWAMKLYERCLVPCASYPEFWMRYVEFLESKGGRELSISALDRATQIFLKNVPEIHLFNATFKEHIGDVNGARAALILCDSKTDSSFIENAVTLANLERRLGNFAAASATYEKALKKAREKQKLHVLPSLYFHFARLTFLITGSAAAARDVLVEGVRYVPHCRFLLEELIKFAMTHEGASQVNIVDSIIADAISPGLDEYEGLSAKDRENISCLLLEFVNLCGTMHDIRKAWNRHIKLFPQFLRIRTTYNHFTSGNYLIDLVRDQKGNYGPPVHSQPSRNLCFGHCIQPQGQEQVPEFPVNHEIHPNQVLKKLLPKKDHINNAKETVQLLSTKAVVLSNEDASQDNGPAYEVSCQSREDKLGPMIVSAELAHQAKENALSAPDSDQDLSYQSRGDKLGEMDVSAGLAKQSKENALSPHESAHEVGKSTETTKFVEVSHSSLVYVQPELDHECKQQKHPFSLDNISLNSQEKESEELIPMSCDENETKRVVPASSENTSRGISNVNFNSFAGPQSIQTVESPQVHNELERDGSVSCQHNIPTKMHTDPEGPSSTCEDSIEIDHMVPAPGLSTSGFQEHAQDQEHQLEQSFYHDHHPANALDSKILVNLGNAQQNSARQKRGLSQLGAVQEDKATEQDWPTSMMTPSITMSAGLPPVSSQPVSYPQQNMNQISSLSSQHPWQAPQNLAVNQMLQYHYQQQQLLQQQYQQQLHIQHPYFQQHVPQQHYAQQQQHQSPPYQLQQQIPSFQQSQQQLQQQYHQQSQQILGHLQLQQGQDPHLNFLQAHEKQYHQPQDLAYQAHQLAYQQQASQEQQLLLQHYQQYQGYQHLQHEQQSKEGPTYMQEQHIHQHPAQKQQDEQLQQHHQQVISKQNLTQNMSQNQQGSKISLPDYDVAAEASESPHLRVQSPQV
ncbi:hypothetical protein Pfo_023455, partial [Paulownia fortunei]